MNKTDYEDHRKKTRKELTFLSTLGHIQRLRLEQVSLAQSLRPFFIDILPPMIMGDGLITQSVMNLALYLNSGDYANLVDWINWHMDENDFGKKGLGILIPSQGGSPKEDMTYVKSNDDLWKVLNLLNYVESEV